MSHYAVLVCLPGETPFEDITDAIATAVEPYNENTRVEPYKDFEKGNPGEFWWVKHVRGGAEHHRNGTGVLPHYPDDPYGYKHPGKSSREPEDVQRAGYADDAAWAERLGEDPTWELVTQLYNQKWHGGTNGVVPLGEPAEDEDGRYHYDPDEGRMYRLSTYNPRSKWDWYQIGGRWQRNLAARQGVDRSCLIYGDPGTFGDNGRDRLSEYGGLNCDGAQREFLDFEAMRDEAAVRAGKRYDHWERVASRTDPAKPWSHFMGLVELKELEIGEARRQYHAQPRVELAQKEELSGWFGCVVEEFLPDREEYLRLARLGAVPTYALLTLEGEWMAPGEMGWFGMSTDGPGEREGYQIAVNEYLEKLDPTAYVVLVDMHI